MRKISYCIASRQGVKTKKFFLILAAAIFLAACQRPGIGFISPDESLAPPQSALPDGAPPGGLFPAVDFDKLSGDLKKDTPQVVSGRLLPVVDREGKTVVGWRIVGEIYNPGSELINQAAIFIGIKNVDSEEQTILPDEVQTGGFLPIQPGARSVYDVLINGAYQAQSISIGVKILSSDQDQKQPAKFKISLENIQFKQLDDKSGFSIKADVVNTSGKTLKKPTVRMWAVVDQGQIPAGAKTSDEVVAVNTWQSGQEVLNPGQRRPLEATLLPLSNRDSQLIATMSAQLSIEAIGEELEL